MATKASDVVSEAVDEAATAIDRKTLEADVKQLRKDIDKLVSQLSKTGQHSVGAARRAAAVGVDELRSRAEDLEGQLTDRVREKPITSLAIAAGIGYVFALLSRR